MKALHSSTSSSEGRGRRAFFGVCWAAALVLAVDLLCRLVLPAGAVLDMASLTRERAEMEVAPDIQVVGDSVARSGLMVSALSDGELTVRNDAMPASGTPKTYLLLARQFEQGRVPRVLVISHSPHTFKQVRYELLVGGYAYWREIPELAQYAETWTDVLYGVMSKLSYVLRNRDPFQDLLKKGDAGFFLDRDYEIFPEPDNERLRKFGSAAAAGRFAKSNLPAEAGDFYREPFEVASMNDAYFRKILALARRHGVKVFWITMPTPPQVMQARSSVDYEEQMLKYLRQFEVPGEFEILRGPFSVYRPELFTDLLHLNNAGAVQFACELKGVNAPIVKAAARVEATAVSAVRVSMPPKQDRFSAQLAPFCTREASPMGGPMQTSSLH